MRVLVIDDSEADRFLVKTILVNAGYEVETASNGMQALEIVRRGACRLIVSDWEMPGMSGLELCRAIRCTDLPGYVYIVLLTAHDKPQEKVDGLTAGADDFIIKPFNPNELLGRIKTGERILSAGLVELRAEINERRRAEESLKARSRQQAVIAELGQRALRGIDLPTLLNEAVEGMALTLDTEFCNVFKLLPDGKSMLLVAGVGWKHGLVGTATVDAGVQSQVGYTLLSQAAVIVENLRSETRFNGPPLLHEHDVVSGVTVVVPGNERPFGILGVHSRKQRVFTGDDIHFLQSIAHVLSATSERIESEAAMRNSEDRYRSLVLATSQAVWSTNARGEVVEDLPTWRALSGQSTGQIMGFGWMDVLHPDDRERTAEQWAQSIRTAETYDCQYRIRAADGTWRDVHARGIPVRGADGTIREWIGTCTDITDRKRMERVVVAEITDRKRAETKLVEQQKELERNNQRLAELYQTAQRFVDNVSHEFRTPLTVIKGYAEVVQQGMAGPVNEQQKEFLEFILDRSRDLAQMVDDLLDSSKLRAGTLRIDRRAHQVEQVLTHIRPLIAPKASANKVELVEEIEDALPDVFVDAEKVGRIIVNLAINAIKFSPEGSRITIWARHAAGGLIEIGVTDYGPGISPENLREIFERFQQVGNPQDGTTKGFGLGLNIARELVALNLGEIAVKSTVGQGSTFSFTVPRNDPAIYLRQYMASLNAVALNNQTICLLRITPLSDAGMTDEMRGLLASIVRATELVVEATEHGSLLLVGCTSNPEAWLQRLREAAAESLQGTIGIEHLASWRFPAEKARAESSILEQLQAQAEPAFV